MSDAGSDSRHLVGLLLGFDNDWPTAVEALIHLLGAIAEHLGYPLFMKPFDGGGWRGVSMVSSYEELQAAYDASGRMLMHLQAAVKDYDVFARSLSIGAETMVMHFDASRPMHDRYQ